MEITIKVPDENDVSLTKTEVKVMALIMGGMSNREIGVQLNVSVRTIETHRAHILKKTKCRNTAQLVMFAIKYFKVQLIEDPVVAEMTTQAIVEQPEAVTSEVI